MGLELVDGLDVLLGGYRPSEPPSGHGVGLGETRHQEGAVEHAGERCDGCVLALVDDGLVDLVGKDHDVVGDSDFRDLLQDLPGHHGACGVGGGVEDDHLRPRGHGGLDHRGVHDELVLVLRGDVDGDSPGQTDARLVGDPGRVHEDDLVPGIDVCQRDHEDRLLGGRDENV